MSLHETIPPEILNDDFYKNLQRIAERPDLKTFLEIGSSSGGGSTQAIVNGLAKRADLETRLFCIELSQRRFADLVGLYEQYPFVLLYNFSSVGLSDFPLEQMVREFYESALTNLNKYDLEVVLGWLREDINYVEARGLNFCGINLVKSCNRIKNFDFVLIDRSEFTGEAELQYIWGSKVIALDDINTYKCFAAYRKLSTNCTYRSIVEDCELRNGYAIFERVCCV